MKTYLFFIYFLFLSNPASLAFPELVRHGYLNCNACHFSPSGGGVLTEYGRSLSKEVVSTWGNENEEDFFYYAKSTDKLALGGNFRGIQVQNKYLPSGPSSNRYYNMQEDLELAANFAPYTFVISFGHHVPNTSDPGEWLSHTHYVMYKGKNEDHIFRFGRFFPMVGLYIPEHSTSIRKGLIWDQGRETYNFEHTYYGEDFNFQSALILGRPDKPNLYREKGVSVTYSYHPADTHKIGLTYYYGESDLVSHHIFGPYGIFGFNPKLFLLSQLNIVRTFNATNQNPQNGIAHYQKLGYEIYQGVIPFVTIENLQLDATSDITKNDTYTLGIQFFPRPHWEFQLYVQKKFINWQAASDLTAFYWHFYP